MNKEIKNINVLFIGDIFGESGIKKIEKEVPILRKKYNVDLVIAQSENVSGRKGLDPKDYQRLSQVGIDVFTLGNHAFAKSSILEIINEENIIRPFNVNEGYEGKGTNIFVVNNIKVRVTSLLGITFNDLNAPWKQQRANNFFDAIDEIIKKDDSDFHIIDFHAETTSEKNVLALYLDKTFPGKVSAIIGTHTHVQTNDSRRLKNNTLFITDAGMTGPKDSAIGANFDEVYEKMRFNSKSRFVASLNKSQLNGVLLSLSKNSKSKIKTIKK